MDTPRKKYPRLSVLIATFQPEGIRRVEAMRLPEVEGVEYVVSWQEHEDAPVPEALSERKDVRIFRLSEKGVSNNRNNAMAHARGELMLMSDDDLIYTPENLLTVIQAFDTLNDADYISFRYEGPAGKRYPKDVMPLNPLPKGFSQCCFEIALRRNALTDTLRFNPLFGPGAPYLKAAEDEVFLLEALRKGVKAYFYPATICIHPDLTTGSRPYTIGVLRAAGAFILLSTPLTALVRIPLKAWRLAKTGQSPFFSGLFAMLQGAACALTKKPLRKIMLASK